MVGQDERGWETMQGKEPVGPAAVFYKTLINGDPTRSEVLTMGVAKVPPGAALSEHRHRQAEVYLVLAGEGSIRIGARVRAAVQAGLAVFVPGDVVPPVRTLALLS